jgi:hypothetical protein
MLVSCPISRSSVKAVTLDSLCGKHITFSKILRVFSRLIPLPTERLAPSRVAESRKRNAPNPPMVVE